MSFLINVKPGHPTGVRRRSGQTFTAVPVEVACITDEMRADPWLQIVESPERQSETGTETEALAPGADTDPSAGAFGQHADLSAICLPSDLPADDLAPRRGRKK